MKPSMATALSQRILSPAILLYSFVVVTQFGFGLYLGRQMETPPAYTLLHWAAQLWIIGWWLRADSRKRGIVWVYDLGFFLSIAWPLIIPYHLLKTRGAKGLLVILGWVAAYYGAAIAGMIVVVATLILSERQ
jgi:hypothetical protein